jgi:signal transduction histidine kinase
MVRLWVEDNGLGIPPELSGKLFGVFQRLHTGPRYPGTGIGLAIVKKAAERMGGRVGMEPAAPQGSRFWVELRSPRSPQQSQSVAPLAA